MKNICGIERLQKALQKPIIIEFREYEDFDDSPLLSFRTH
jgi:hypothetical protein